MKNVLYPSDKGSDSLPYKRICRSVGTVHLGVAGFFLLYFIVELLTAQSASALLLIYFLTTGILLRKGNLRVVTPTAFLSGLLTGLFACIVLLLLFELPFGLIWASLKFETVSFG